MIGGLSYTVRTTGFFSLYRGLAPTLVGSIPKAGIRFGLNAVIKDSLRDKNGNTNIKTPKKSPLGKWITQQRKQWNPWTLDKDKYNTLRNMGFIWQNVLV